MEGQNEKKMRLDKWLKVALIFKTRSQASEACEQGKVAVNEQVAKASKTIKIGDTVSVKYKWKKRIFDVLDISHKSLPVAKARLLYNEHEPTLAEIEAEDQRKLFYQASKKLHPKYKGRPTKKEGRKLRRIRGF